MIGIKTFYSVAANVVFTSSATLATVGLTSPIAAGQRLKFRAWVPVTVGATGGVRYEVIGSAGVVITGGFIETVKLFNTVAPLLTTASLTANAAFTNALANAGTHWLEIEGDFTNSGVAGTLDLQFAQNTTDANTLTVLKGATMDVTQY
jgi:hypothetical protein